MILKGCFLYYEKYQWACYISATYGFNWWCESCSKCGWGFNFWLKWKKALPLTIESLNLISSCSNEYQIVALFKKSVLCSDICQSKSKYTVCTELIQYLYDYFYIYDRLVVITKIEALIVKNKIKCIIIHNNSSVLSLK